METVTGSTQEIADRMGVEYGTALALLKLLTARGIVKSAGVRPSPRGKGKGANLFTVPTGVVTLTLFPTNKEAG